MNDNYSNEISLCDNELERLKDVEYKEQSIKEKLNVYVSNVKKDVELLDKLKKNSLDKGITLEVWEKIEDIELGIKSKLEKVLKALSKTDKILSEVKENREKCNSKKAMMSKEIERNNHKLSRINERLNNDDYLDYTRKIKDLNKKELIRIELNELKNKKDVIYVNVDMVKDELIREWSKNSDDSSVIKAVDRMANGESRKVEHKDAFNKAVDNSFVKNQTISKIEVKKEEVVEVKPVEEKKESNKIELDW